MNTLLSPYVHRTHTLRRMHERRTNVYISTTFTDFNGFKLGFGNVYVVNTKDFLFKSYASPSSLIWID